MQPKEGFNMLLEGRRRGANLVVGVGGLRAREELS